MLFEFCKLALDMHLLAQCHRLGTTKLRYFSPVMEGFITAQDVDERCVYCKQQSQKLLWYARSQSADMHRHNLRTLRTMTILMQKCLIDCASTAYVEDELVRKLTN